MASAYRFPRPRWLWRTVFVVAALAFSPAPAAACSFSEVVYESTYPVQDAVDVPTNAVLFVYGPNLVSNPQFDLELLDENGAPVPAEVRLADPSGFDVAPLAPLAPNRKYELRAYGLPPSQRSPIEFTTGSGPAAVPDSLNKPELDLTMLTYPHGNCGLLSGLCVDTSSQPNTTLEVRVGEEVLSSQQVLSSGADTRQSLYRAYSQPVLEHECVDVRARDVRGNRSEPNVICGDAIRRFILPEWSSETPYTCDDLDFTGDPEAVQGADALAVVESDGCALGRTRPVGSNVASLGLGLVALLAARRWCTPQKMVSSR